MHKTEELKEQLQNGGFDERLAEIYVDKDMLDYQKARYVRSVEKFEELYGAGEAEIYSAPGRSEVGGNHTDHQQGEVLAASVNLDAIAVVRKTEDNTIQLLSEGHAPSYTLIVSFIARMPFSHSRITAS